MLAGLSLIGLAACGLVRGEEPDAGTEAKAAPGRGANPTPATRSLPTGATIDVTLDETISSRRNEAGQTVTTTVGADLTDGAGRVVVPAGSVLELKIVEITPAKHQSQEDGTLVLQVTGIWVRDQSYALSGEITSLAHTLEGREKVVIAGTPVGITLASPLKVASP